MLIRGVWLHLYHRLCARKLYFLILLVWCCDGVGTLRVLKVLRLDGLRRYHFTLEAQIPCTEYPLLTPRTNLRCTIRRDWSEVIDMLSTDVWPLIRTTCSGTFRLLSCKLYCLFSKRHLLNLPSRIPWQRINEEIIPRLFV